MCIESFTWNGILTIAYALKTIPTTICTLSLITGSLILEWPTCRLYKMLQRTRSSCDV